MDITFDYYSKRAKMEFAQEDWHKSSTYLEITLFDNEQHEWMQDNVKIHMSLEDAEKFIESAKEVIVEYKTKYRS